MMACARLVSACAKDEGSFGEATPTTTDTRTVKPVSAPAPPDFGNALKVSATYDKATNVLRVGLDVAPGFHAYADGEKVGVPVSIDVADGMLR